MTKTFLNSTALAAILLIGACAVGPDYKRPDVETPAAFKEAPLPPPAPVTKDFIGPRLPETGPAKALVKAQPKDDAARGKWWQVFSDQDLNKLEEQVAISNQNVKAQEGAYRQAKALVEEARSQYFPTLGATGSMDRSGTGSGAGRSSGSTLGGTIRNNYNAELQASWVPDLWGQIRREVESEKASAQASAAQLASATLAAQATLASDYINLRLDDEQKRVLDRAVDEYTRSLKITQNQYKSGIAANSDVLQAKVQLESAQAQAVDIGEQRALYEHAIAVLVGKAPGNFTIPVVNSIPPIPPLPEAVPSQLLERRPDIAEAERNVAAANAQIGVQEAAFFPQLTLAATGGYASTELYQWFAMPFRFWSIGPSLVETVFDAGLRAAKTDAAIGTYDQEVATYRQTVLAAFQSVEDNLAQLRVYAEEEGVLQNEVKDARASVTVALNQYKSGIVNYISVITTQTAELNSELSLINVHRARLVAAANLIDNLGGGWDAATLRKPEVTEGNTGILSILPPAVDKP